MKLVILTSNTPHHNYFVRNIQRDLSQVSVFYETGAITPPYNTYHSYQDEQINHETNLWGESSLEINREEVCHVSSIENVNDLDVNAELVRFADICIVFGTRRINTSVIDKLPKITVNLHGGDPEFYRGLDSHLWSIWHGDQSGLKTCLHMIKPTLDSGEIVEMEKLDLKNVEYLHELRAANTTACLKICHRFLAKVSSNLELHFRPQIGIGRYYSFMPSELKQIVVKKFSTFRLEIEQ
jgi:methionyl-tRNA formyltransferase